MVISVKYDYLCRALLELSLHWPNTEPLSISEISKKQHIPMKYLVHILLQLKDKGLVESIRGKEGGYRLTKPPRQITLGEVLREKENNFFILPPSIKRNSIFFEIWKKVNREIFNVLEKVNFEDIVEKARKIKKTFVYQI
jgi:Rrf2 family protein